MTFAQILRLPARHLRAHPWAIALILAAIVTAALWPADPAAWRSRPQPMAQNPVLLAVDGYGRHLNTLAALGALVVLRDATGARQLAVATLAGLAATHGPKGLLDDVTVFGTRLGERPYGADSHHNMPSGHAALAAAAIWFLGRRFSWHWLWLTVPVTLLTGAARVAVGAHTPGAVVAGLLIGLLVTALFTTRRR